MAPQFVKSISPVYAVLENQQRTNQNVVSWYYLD